MKIHRLIDLLIYSGLFVCMVVPSGTFAQENSSSQQTKRTGSVTQEKGAKESGTVIVLNKSEASASLLDRATGKEYARLETGVGPHEVAVSPDNLTAVVCNYGERLPGSTLTVLDLGKGAVEKTIELKKFHRPHGICYLPDGKRVVVTAERERNLLVVNVESGEVESVIPTRQEVSHMVALTPNAQRAFVANIGSGSVSVIDLESAELLKVIPTGNGAEGVDVAPDGKTVWISNRGADSITVLDAQSLEPRKTLPCPSFPIRVKFTPNGEHVLVSCARSGDVAVFDAQSHKLVRRIKMDAKPVETEGRLFGDQFGESPVPVGILIPPDGRLALVANTNADLVTVIDLDKWEIVDRWTAGKEPDGLGFVAPTTPNQ